MPTSERVHLKNVRLANFYGHKPYNKPNNRGELKYRSTFILDVDSENDKLVKAAIMNTAEAEFGPNWKTIVAAMEPSKKCLRSGDQALDSSGNIREGFAGKKFVSSANKDKPAIVWGKKGTNGKFIPIDADEGKPYNGCYVNAMVDVTSMGKWEDAPNNIYAKLIAVQFLSDATAFAGGGGVSADGFDEVEGQDVPAAGASDPFSDAAGGGGGNDDLGI